MKRFILVFLIIACVWSVGNVLSAEEPESVEKFRASEAILCKIHHSDLDRLLDELERSVGNLERRMDRLEDRIENLDHDLEALKRKS